MVIEWDCIILEIPRFNKKYKLPYLKKTYQELEDQSSSYIYRLRSIGKKVRIRQGKYQLLLSTQKVSYKLKTQIINKILNIKNKDGSTLNDYILFKFDIDGIKTKLSFESDYSIILDILATFYMSDGNKLSLLTDKLLKRIKKYEVCNYDDTYSDVYGTSKFAINKVSKSYIEKYENNNRKIRTRKWKNSKTYKLNKVLSELNSYEAVWCYINNENIFSFENKLYKVSNIKSYKQNSNDDLSMDSILVIRHENELFYYDMDINPIDKKYVFTKNIEGS